MTPNPDGRADDNGRKGEVPWDLIIQAVGAGTALSAWIAVVGGARVWAKLHAAEIPTTQTVSVLPRQLLVAEGLQALLVPLLVGAGLAILVYYSRERKEERAGAAPAEEKPTEPERAENAPAEEQPIEPERGEKERRDERGMGFGAWLENAAAGLVPLRAIDDLRNDYHTSVLATMAAACLFGLLLLVLAIVRVNWGVVGIAGVVALIAVLVLVWTDNDGWAVAAGVLIPLAGMVVALGLVVRLKYIVAISVVTVAALWLTVGALKGRGPKGVGWTLFAAFAGLSGALGFLRELGTERPELERATVQREDGRTERGFYLGGGAGDVYLATEEPPRQVILVREKDVASLTYGGRAPVALQREENGGEEAPKPTPAPTGKPPGPSGIRTVLGAADKNVDGAPLRLEVVGLRIGRRLVVVDLRLIHRRARPSRPQFSVGSLLDDAAREPPDAVDGLELTDVNDSRTYRTARAGGRCLCTTGLARVALAPGQSVILTAVFGRPPGDRFLLLVPRFGTIAVARPS